MAPKQQAFNAPSETFGGGDFKSEKEFQRALTGDR